MNTPAWTISNDKHRVDVDHATGMFYIGQRNLRDSVGLSSMSLYPAPSWPDHEIDINEHFRVDPID